MGTDAATYSDRSLATRMHNLFNRADGFPMPVRTIRTGIGNPIHITVALAAA
ncbi:hypothetical protein [Methylobacter sp.]|jgi:hypothetical protein|uniref:hypothetical protein n=1 Tax=Methylobacter sp. TaxID=2051955 RepID=UPI003DA2A20B